MRRLGRLGYKALIVLFAAIGFVTLADSAACALVRPAFYLDTRYPDFRAPSGSLAAYRQVTRGGLGTVWTTRFYLHDRDVPGSDRLIYQARDSDNPPGISWLDAETLRLVLPCDRVDYLSNPGDWNDGATPMQRAAVRFSYSGSCGSAASETRP